MKKYIITYGLIGGIIVATQGLIVTSLCYSEQNFDYSKGMVIGYASMIIAFSLVFVGIRTQRNKFNNGVISFGKAFKTGLFIALITSTVYVVAWLIYYYCFMPDFAEKYSAYMLAQLKAKGAGQLEIDQKAKQMATFARMYKNPFFSALVTYSEILPVGLVITLISALILKRKAPKS